MGRKDYRYAEQVDFRGGFNLEPENARPNQLLTARNVWTPDGRLETRPGHRGVIALGEPEVIDATTAQVSAAYEVVATGAIITAAINNIPFVGTSANPAQDRRYYFGFSSNSVTQFYLADSDGVAAGNSNAVDYMLEYYAGDDIWIPLESTQKISTTFVTGPFEGTNKFMGLSDGTSTVVIGQFTFVPPCGWTLLDLQGNGTERHWIRLTLIPSGDPYLSQNFAGNLDDIATIEANDGTSFREIKAMFAPQFASGKRYLFGGRWSIDSTNFDEGDWGFDNSSRLDLGDTTKNLDLATVAEDEPASYANVSLFDEAYVAYNYTITRHLFDGTNELAPVETDPLLVGIDPDTGLRADYNPDYVAQLPEFPRAKFVTFFDNRLFVANLDGNETAIRWSAAAPAQRVWPVINFDNLIEDDNSPITGLSSLNENVIVFKNDSIWQLISLGDTDIGEAVYTPRKIVSGIGAVSNSSIARTPLGLMFLAEDGVYLFTGSPQVQKISVCLVLAPTPLYVILDIIDRP